MPLGAFVLLPFCHPWMGSPGTGCVQNHGNISGKSREFQLTGGYIGYQWVSYVWHIPAIPHIESLSSKSVIRHGQTYYSLNYWNQKTIKYNGELDRSDPHMLVMRDYMRSLLMLMIHILSVYVCVKLPGLLMHITSSCWFDRPRKNHIFRHMGMRSSLWDHF